MCLERAFWVFAPASLLLFLARTLMADSPWPISVQVEDVAAKRIEKIGEVFAQAQVGAMREWPLPDMKVSLRATQERGACRMTVGLTDFSGRDREVAVHFALPGSHGFRRALCPDGQNVRDCAASWGASYRASLVLPLISLYTPGAAGLTLCADFDEMIPGLLFRCSAAKDKEGIAAIFQNRRLPANGLVEITLYAIPHEGDWRPGLGWALERWPEYFRPQGQRVYEYEGGMIYDFITVPEERIVRDKALNLQWQEVGWSWPHLGLYVPETETWQHQSSKDGGYGAGGQVTRQALRDYLALLRKHHVGSFMYFQSTEAWQEYAERNFPESIVRKPDGSHCPTWVKCVVMNPNPEGPFGRHILAQVEAMLRVFPEIDGLFWDQNCYGGNDFAQQDEFTMVGGRRCSNLEIAQRRMLGIAGPRLHAAGKAIWSNGPVSIGVARHIDGAMSEGTAGARRMAWLCLAKPLIILSYDTNLAATEQKLMAALETGGQPAVTLGKEPCRQFEARYLEMLKLLLCREVVLTAYAYEPPTGFRGNIFRRADGNLLVTLVRESGMKAPVMVEMAVRPPKGTKVRAVYELIPEAKGLRQCAFVEENGALRWTVVSPQTAAMYLLAVRGRFFATAQRFVLPETASDVTLQLNNFTDGPWTTEVSGKNVVAQPMSVQEVVVPVAPQPEGSAAKFSVSHDVVGPATIEVSAQAAVGIRLLPEQPTEINASATTVSFALLNRTATDVQPSVRAVVEGGEAEFGSPLLRAGHAVELPVNVRNLSPGPHKITVTVAAQGTQSHIEHVIHITRDVIPDVALLRTAKWLTVTMDIFNSLGGQWAEKPVRVNGVEIGKLPITGTTLRWHKAMSVKAPGDVLREIIEKALAADSAYATFRVTVDNAVKNCFKVKECKISFGLADGTILSSAPKPFVRCSDQNWLYTEGESVRLGEPVEAGVFRFATGPAP